MNRSGKAWVTNMCQKLEDIRTDIDKLVCKMDEFIVLKTTLKMDELQPLVIALHMYQSDQHVSQSLLRGRLLRNERPVDEERLPLVAATKLVQLRQIILCKKVQVMIGYESGFRRC
ncbi:hypothetical protein HanIR_Chr00c07g0906241 [Helianthus annuus]|nr:hypothetical protein HanIR_Chr00c07g0906241 [Helianthus annuus]